MNVKAGICPQCGYQLKRGELKQFLGDMEHIENFLYCAICLFQVTYLKISRHIEIRAN